MTRKEKIIYFSLSLLLFMVFRHMLGPALGLEGLTLTISAYAFAGVLATIYLYKIFLRSSSHSSDKKDA